MICVYSLRPREKPLVSLPLAWQEVESYVGRESEAHPAFGLSSFMTEYFWGMITC